MAEIKYVYSDTGGNKNDNETNREKLVILLFLFTIGLILLGLLFFFLKKYESQMNLNIRTSSLIEQSERELGNLKNQLDSVENLISSKGIIYVQKEDTLKLMLKERRIIVIKLKEQLFKQKVLKNDFQSLSRNYEEIKMEVARIITKVEENRMTYKQLESAIISFRDSIKMESQKTKKKAPKDLYYCNPQLELSIYPNDDNCSSEFTSDRPNAKINCFKITIVVKKNFKGHENFILSIQPSNKPRLLFTLYDKEHNLISKNTAHPKINLPEMQPYDFYIDFQKSLDKKLFPLKFYISQDIPECKEFNCSKIFTNQY